MTRPLSRLLAAALLLGPLPGWATDHNGHGLLAQCRAAQQLVAEAPLPPAGREAAMYCLGYVRGITRFVVISQLLKPGSQMFCPPPQGIRTRDAVDVVVDYLEDHPERLSAQKVTLAAAAFMRAWPCTPPEWPDGPPPVGLEDRWQPAPQRP